MTQMEYTFTGWCCDDCMFMHANGELGHDDVPDEEPWGLLEAGTEVTMGLGWDEHECWSDMTQEEADAYFNGHTSYRATRESIYGVEYLPDECECERIEFSSGWCDGCGTRLAGSRNAFTFWARRA